MIRRVAVGDIMTRNFVSVTPETDLFKCSKELVKNKIKSLLVSKDHSLLGILTARDVLWAVIKKPGVNLKDLKVTDIATRKIAVIKPSADVGQALHKMKQFGFRRLPVLSKGRLVGIVTLKDILKIDPNLYEQLGELVEIREESHKLKRIAELEDGSLEFEGLCGECGAFSELLRVEGVLLCRDCRDEMY